MKTGCLWFGALVGAGCGLVSTSVSAQEWLRWDEKPLATQRDPSKLGVLSPSEPRPDPEPPPLVPLRRLSELREPASGNRQPDSGPSSPTRAIAGPQVAKASPAPAVVPPPTVIVDAAPARPADAAMPKPGTPASPPDARETIAIAKAELTPDSMLRVRDTTAMASAPRMAPPALSVPMEIARTQSPTQPSLEIASTGANTTLHSGVSTPALSTPMEIVRMQSAIPSALRISAGNAPVGPLHRVSAPALTTSMEIAKAVPARSRSHIDVPATIAPPARLPDQALPVQPRMQDAVVAATAAPSVAAMGVATSQCIDPSDCVTPEDLRATAVSSQRIDPNERQAIEAEIKRSLLRGH